jgi:hypothetical protein
MSKMGGITLFIITVLVSIFLYLPKIFALPTVEFSLAGATSSSESDSFPAQLTVILSEPSAEIVTVDVLATGTANSLPEGTGRDYELSSEKLTFQAGETSQTLSITVVDDTLAELDESIELTLANPVNADLGNIITHNQTILDDAIKLMVNVKDYGATGNGATLDKTAVQNAINYLKAQGGGILFFPKGTYLIYNIQVPYNVTLIGEGNRESILKVPDNTEGFWRMIKSYESGYNWIGDTDSPPLIFQNLTIDGNGPNQAGWGTYVPEQKFMIAVGGSNTKPGKLKVIFENCEIKHSVSDGISVLANVDVTVYNCLFKSNFRGSVTVLGGQSITKIKKVQDLNDTPGVRTISFQQEMAVFGYNNTRKADMYIEDAYAENTVDIGMAYDALNGGDGTVIYMKNVDVSKGDYIFGGWGAHWTVEDSKFRAAGGWMLSMQDATFNRTEFILSKQVNGNIPSGAVYINWNCCAGASTTHSNQVLTFNDCTFTADDSISVSDLNTRAITIGLSDDFRRNNKVVVNGGTVTNKLKHVFDSLYGVTSLAEFRNVNIATNDLAFKLSGSELFEGRMRYQVTFDNLHLANNTKFARFWASSPGCKIIYQNMTVDESTNWLQSANQSLTVSPPTVEGERTILGANPPTSSTHGLIGDIYRLKSDPRQRWQCTKASYWIDYSTGAQIPGTWIALPTELFDILYGDVSGDGNVSAYDASLAGQAAVGFITLSEDQKKKADVTGDSNVSAYDASLIAQKAVGLINKFPVEG